MKVDILKITDINDPRGTLLEVLKVETKDKDLDSIVADVGSVLITFGKEHFGDDAKFIANDSIFGGYVRNSEGHVIVAR